MTPAEIGTRIAALPSLPPFRLVSAASLPDPLALLDGFYTADLHTYPEGYQVELPKLQSALQIYPEGFTLLQIQTSQGWLPAGYTAIHPVDPGPPRLPIAPVPYTPQSWLYIFNYSAHPRFHRTPLTRALLQALAVQVARYPNKKLAATVSPDGERIAARLGLRSVTTLSLGGLPWLWWESAESDSGAL